MAHEPVNIMGIIMTSEQWRQINEHILISTHRPPVILVIESVNTKILEWLANEGVWWDIDHGDIMIWNAFCITGLFRGESTVHCSPVDYPHKGPVMHSFGGFNVEILDKQLTMVSDAMALMWRYSYDSISQTSCMVFWLMNKLTLKIWFFIINLFGKTLADKR